MRVMVFVKATSDSEKMVMPTYEAIAEMGKFNEELSKAGILVDCDGLKPTSHAKRVSFNGTDRTVKDGPFSTGAPEELVAGWWIWNVKDMNEAIAWVKKCPNPMPGPSEIEIRPFFEAGDFA